MLLLDEPLAALDKKLRESTQHELMELQRRLGMTFIIVTHDQEEAMTMASRIGVMDAGRLDQVATPRDLYEAPASRWIAEFVGDINLFEGEVDTREQGRLTVATRDAGTIVVAEPRKPRHEERRQRRDPPRKGKVVAPRPGVDAANPHAINRLEGVITDVSYLGGLDATRSSSIPARWCARRWRTPRGSSDAYNAGQRVVAWFTPDDCLVLEQ